MKSLPTLLILSISIASAGCVGAPLSAAEIALKQLAADESRFEDFQTAPIRYNPARCECPAFEIRLEGRWYRVEIVDADEGPGATLIADAIGAGPGWKATVNGELDGLERKRYRSPVLRLQVTEVCSMDGCAVEDLGESSGSRPQQ